MAPGMPREPGVTDLRVTRPLTGLIIAACVAAYIALALVGGRWLSIDAGDLIRFGGSYAPAIAAGEVWRLWSAIFLHGSLLHLLVNMIALRDVGGEVERRDGMGVLLAVFLLTGAAGFVASAASRPEVVSIGASGGILGLIGHWGVSLWRARGLAQDERRGRLQALVVYLALIFGMGALVPGIDQWAHLGGVVAGTLLALLRRPTGSSGADVRRQPVFWAACLGLAVALPLAAAFFPDDWQARFVEHEDFVARYRVFATQDREVNARLQAIGSDSRAGRITDAEAIATIDREVLPRLAENRQHWQNARFATPSLEAERQLWVRYASLREDAVQALRQAAVTSDRDELRRFETLMAEAAKLVERNAQPDGRDPGLPVK